MASKLPGSSCSREQRLLNFLVLPVPVSNDFWTSHNFPTCLWSKPNFCRSFKQPKNLFWLTRRVWVMFWCLKYSWKVFSGKLTINICITLKKKFQFEMQFHFKFFFSVKGKTINASCFTSQCIGSWYSFQISFPKNWDVKNFMPISLPELFLNFPFNSQLGKSADRMGMPSSLFIF